MGKPGRPAPGLDDYLYWQERLASRLESGLGIDDFCADEDISRSTFHRWSKRLENGIPAAVKAGEAVTLADHAGPKFLPVTVTVDGRPTLPSDVHVALYRIAQETLNNVVKHAQPSQVTVALHFTRKSTGGRVVELRVTDDGRGFDPQHIPPDRLGLGIIRERAQAVGATLQVESRPGHGTQVVVVWEEENGR